MEVLQKEEKILSKEEAAEFYKQHEGSEHFDQLVEFMSRYFPIFTVVSFWLLSDGEVREFLLQYYN